MNNEKDIRFGLNALIFAAIVITYFVAPLENIKDIILGLCPGMALLNVLAYIGSGREKNEDDQETPS